MKTYISPKMVTYGNSKEAIQGNCGWGNENAYLDKTGYYEKYISHCAGIDNCVYDGYFCTNKYSECQVYFHCR